MEIEVNNQTVLIDEKDYQMLTKKFGDNIRFEVRHLKGRSNPMVVLRKQVNKQRLNMIVARLLLRITEKPDVIPVYVDRNPLNLQRSNLKKANRANAMKGRRSATNSSSKYLGVYWSKNHRKWRACIKPSSGAKNMHLGLFVEEKEAAQAYNDAAHKFHGKFANLNPID